MTCARCSDSVHRARRSPWKCGSAPPPGVGPASLPIATSPSTWTTRTVSGCRTGAGRRRSSSPARRARAAAGPAAATCGRRGVASGPRGASAVAWAAVRLQGVARAVGVAAGLPARGRARQRPVPGRARGRGADRAALGAEHAAPTGRRRGTRRLCPARQRLPRWPPAPAGGGGRRRHAGAPGRPSAGDGAGARPRREGVRAGARGAASGVPPGHHRRVPDHRSHRGSGAGCGQRRGALRPGGSRPHGPPRPARRPVADALAEGTVRLARRRVDGPERHPQQRFGAHLHRR